MARKSKKQTTPRDRTKDRGGLAAEGTQEPKARKGGLGLLMGHSVTAVVRRMGLEGATKEQMQAILDANKIKMSPSSMRLQLWSGRISRRPAAPITKEQVKELFAFAPEAEKEAAAA